MLEQRSRRLYLSLYFSYVAIGYTVKDGTYYSHERNYDPKHLEIGISIHLYGAALLHKGEYTDTGCY